VCHCSCEAVLAHGGEGDVRHHLNAGVGLTANDGPWRRVRGVKWYHHANHAPILLVNLGQSIMVDQSVPVITKADECVVQHCQEPQAMQACGTQSPILGEVEVKVIIRLHLKHRHNNVTNPLSNAHKANTEFCI
jgi:hypothetical protein